ncbi:sulfonate ABC transporter permease [Caldinitratiruptor microaerophilus]|uniref:Sulfonate ABC transporter permease n=1 Tax=Caldinitratiruptor microaerophilus TaxID=671077 RepID=A0AA35G5X2_9FIRM|nr:sulfonate ABC transporter permease [Caldinitratiruptor microaerophilus]
MIVGIGTLGLVYGIVHVGAGMGAPLEAGRGPAILLDPRMLPYYAGRSLLRMFLAFAFSILFTIVYGYIAAYSRSAERILIPLLDVLQSVPVLGFLSVTVAGFTALFPNRLLGAELASIFAIFTSQVWNMTFSFYHSLTVIPQDLREAARILRLDPWRRLTAVELPYSMVGLVWNGMISFGGGWFFLAASEAITVLGRDIRLPGLGSYLATAVEQADLRAVTWAVVTMVVVVVLVDQLFWRPVAAWTQRFKMEEVDDEEEPSSHVLDVLRRSRVAGAIWRRAVEPVWRAADAALSGLAKVLEGRFASGAAPRVLTRATGAVVGALVLRYAYLALRMLGGMPPGALTGVVGLGLLTLVRVLLSTALAALWTVPVGVAIGLNPRLARVMRPLVQIAASFPANLVFPFLTALYLRYHVNFEIGTIPLMMLGTQWYVLFNVISGATALPADLREAAAMLRLRGWARWRSVYLPAIAPSLVNGCIAAAGGAWNASIVSEIVTWGSTTLSVPGLGAFITQAARVGDWAGIVWGITVMSTLVVLMNRLLWHTLFRTASAHYHA